MEKADLKSLVTQMYENLLDNINNQTDANKEQVVEYLQEAIEVISGLNTEQIDSIEHGVFSTSSWPASIFDRSRISLIKESR